MIQPKNETEDFLLSITNNCEKLIEQTHTEAQETLEIKMIRLKETFHFNAPVEVEEDWMIGLTNLQVHNSIFNITKENNKFQLLKKIQMEKLLVFHMKKSEMRLKETWVFQILQLPIYKTI